MSSLGSYLCPRVFTPVTATLLMSWIECVVTRLENMRHILCGAISAHCTSLTESKHTSIATSAAWRHSHTAPQYESSVNIFTTSCWRRCVHHSPSDCKFNKTHCSCLKWESFLTPFRYTSMKKLVRKRFCTRVASSITPLCDTRKRENAIACQHFDVAPRTWPGIAILCGTRRMEKVTRS